MYHSYSNYIHKVHFILDCGDTPIETVYLFGIFMNFVKNDIAKKTSKLSPYNRHRSVVPFV